MMKLISMSDYVIQQSEIREDIAMHNCYRYAIFLKQKLTIEMFTINPIFENIKIDAYNKIFCGGYVGEIIKGKLFSQKKTIEDLVGYSNIIINEYSTTNIFRNTGTN